MTFNSKQKGIYFLINSYINDNENSEDAEDGNSYNYYNGIAEIGDFQITEFLIIHNIQKRNLKNIRTVYMGSFVTDLHLR